MKITGMKGVALIQIPFFDRIRTERNNPTTPEDAETNHPISRSGAPKYPTTNAPQYESPTTASAITTASTTSPVSATLSQNATRALPGTGFSSARVSLRSGATVDTWWKPEAAP
jgi:hypothetical protein